VVPGRARLERGYAGIGAFVALLARRGTGEVACWPSRLRALGVVAGSLMAVGLASLPAIARQLDDAGTAPPWAWIGSLGWLGTYLVYPVWAAWMARIARRRAGEMVPARALGITGGR
jgi:hypothetical protein